MQVLDDRQVERVLTALGLARLHQGDGFYLVAWNGDAPLGHLHLALTDPPHLQDLEVARDHQRRGVAKALIAAAEREARDRGLSGASPSRFRDFEVHPHRGATERCRDLTGPDEARALVERQGVLVPGDLNAADPAAASTFNGVVD